MKEILCRQNLRPYSSSFLASLQNISAGKCKRALVDESGMIRTQMGTHNRSAIVAVLGTPCAIPPPTVNIILATNLIILSFDGV
jgi:hypothetical protein